MTTMREELDKLLRTMECYDYDADEYKGRHAVHSFAAMLATVLIKNDAHLAKGAQVEHDASYLVEASQRAIPFLRDEASKYDDDGSNEPLETIRDIESAIAMLSAQGGVWVSE